MDTGLHDANPVETALDRALTYLEPSEVQWVVDKMRSSGKDVPPGSGNDTGRRGTVLLSHHQLFSDQGVGKDARGQNLAVNPYLFGDVAALLPDVSLWLWGHEHDMDLYEPYAGLRRGRCLGAGALPILTAQRPVIPAPDLVCDLPTEPKAPRRIANTLLPDNGEVFHHCYGILRLDGPTLTESYYALDSTKAAEAHALGKVSDAPPPVYTKTFDWTKET